MDFSTLILSVFIMFIKNGSRALILVILKKFSIYVSLGITLTQYIFLVSPSFGTEKVRWYFVWNVHPHRLRSQTMHKGGPLSHKQGGFIGKFVFG